MWHRITPSDAGRTAPCPVRGVHLLLRFARAMFWRRFEAPYRRDSICADSRLCAQGPPSVPSVLGPVDLVPWWGKRAGQPGPLGFPWLLLFASFTPPRTPPCMSRCHLFELPIHHSRMTHSNDIVGEGDRWPHWARPHRGPGSSGPTTLHTDGRRALCTHIREPAQIEVCR